MKLGIISALFCYTVRDRKVSQISDAVLWYSHEIVYGDMRVLFNWKLHINTKYNKRRKKLPNNKKFY